MRLENVDGFSFDFTDALDAFVFDEKDKTKETYHGQPMKAVDIVVELDDVYLYIEIKDFFDPNICLLTFDNALNTTMQKILRKELPVGKASRRWKQEFVKSCQVVNVEKWNQQFPKWPVTKSAA